MNEKLSRLQKKLFSLPGKENIVSVLVYGKAIENGDIANDLDIVVVVEKVDSDLNSLFKLLSRYSKNLDFNIYSQKEIKSDLSYYTREYKLEYLSKGICLLGANIFTEEFKKVDKLKYRRSILIRSIEHLQMVRRKYFYSSLNQGQKLNYLKKYFSRISKNILLFKGAGDHGSVNKLSEKEIMEKLLNLGMFSKLPHLEKVSTLEECFELFWIISEALIKCKKEFDSQNAT